MEEPTENTERNGRGRDLLGAEVGQRIRAARLERGMTLAQVGGDDLSRSFLSLVELGRSRISLRALAIVAERLDLPIGYFLDNAASGLYAAGELLLDYVEAALARQQPDEALRLLENSTPSRTLRARFFYLRGSALIQAGRPREAITPLREALTAAQGKADVYQTLQIRYKLGLALYSSDSYDEALTYLMQVVEEGAGEDSDSMLLGRATVCIGHIHYVRNDIETALSYYAKARDLLNSLSGLHDLACLYSGMSVAYERIGDIQNALRYSKLSLGVFEAENNGRNAAGELNNMAIHYREIGDFDQAIQYARDAVRRADLAGAHQVEASAHSTLAAIYADVGDLSASQREAEAAVEMAGDNDALPRIDAWLVLAKLAERGGDRPRADELFQRALASLQTLGHRASFADAALAYSLALRERGDTEGALEYALQAAQARPAQPA